MLKTFQPFVAPLTLTLTLVFAAVLLTVPALAQSSLKCTDSTVPGTFIEWVDGDNLPNAPQRCSNLVFDRWCYDPEGMGPLYEIVPPGCDPEAGPCTLRVKATASMRGNHQSNPFGDVNQGKTAEIFWFDTPQPTVSCSSGCPNIARCGVPGAGAPITVDTGETYLQLAGLSCATAGSHPGLGSYSISIYRCRGLIGCEERHDVGGLVLDEETVKRELGCKEPPKEECPRGSSCNTCLAVGGGGAPAGGGGGGWGGEGSGGPPTGPGARLRYKAGGVGGDGFPGTTAWRTELGLYWSHDYAERIVEDPDDSHVWLLTMTGTFREFEDLVAGAYETASPTDEYRTLTRTAGGWELEDLDGTVMAFDATGRWVSTTDRFGNAKTATYNVSGQLESVSFPDGRSETFTYHASGKLATITEVGVAGAASRTWDYTWGTGADEDLLQRIDLPDGRAYEFTYGDPTLPGYLTLVELVGTSAGRRVMAGFEHDSRGNATALWRGDAVKTGPDAVDVWELAFDDPILPTVTTVTDPLGEVSTYEIGRDDGSRKPRLEALSGSCPACSTGPNSTFQYDDPDHPLRPTRETDARGHHTDFTYDGNGQMLSRTEAVGSALERTTTWTYDSTYPALVTTMEQPSTAGGAALRTTTNTYNAQGALTQRRIEGVEAPGGAFVYDTVYTPSAQGQTLTVDPPGYGTNDQTSFTYDPARGGLVVETRTDPLIGTTTFGYDPYNRRTSVNDVNGVATTTAYDDLNRVTSVTQEGVTAPDDLVTTHEYNEFGDLFRTTMPEGNVIEYGYDAAGRLVTVERKPSAATPAERTFYTLDEIGNRIREDLQRWDGAAWETRSFTEYQYTTRCQLDAVVHADGTRTEYAYDCEGNLADVWDANHPSNGQTEIPTTHYVYDELDRLSEVSQRWGGAGGGFAVTSYGYDVQDHLTSVTDAEGNVTTYDYSDRDLLTEEVSPVSGTTSHLYNEHGELVETTDARNVTMIRTVDELDRFTLMDYPGDAFDVAYVYDDPGVAFSEGRLTAITRDSQDIDYAYDRFGRLTQDGALGYIYDKNGNRQEIVYPGGVTAAYGFDFADRPESLTVQRSGHPDQPVASGAVYEPSGPLAELQLGNGLQESRSWTSRYFPDEIQVSGASTVFQWVYATDSVGNPTSITDALNAANNRTYGYQDFQYFLTQGDGPWGNQSWTYDQIGNRLTETKAGGTDTYAYVPNGGGGNTAILAEITLAATGTRQYAFGPAGHLERVTAPGNEILFTTDAAGRLSRLDRAAGDAAADFLYDGRSFLRSSEAGTVTTLFEDGFESGDASCWDGSLGGTGLNAGTADCSPQPEAEPVYSSDGLLHAVTTRPDVFTETTRHYLHFAGRPVAQLDVPTGGGAASYLWLTTDHLGTPVLATSDTGTTLWEGGFEPFGQDWNGASAVGIDLRFPGQWMDESWRDASEGARSHYNLHRWYEVGTGRYLRVDPLGLKGGSTNLYHYGGSTPLVAFDALGLETCVMFVLNPKFTIGPYIFGTIGHVALYTDRSACGGESDPLLYDPAGGYSPPSGQLRGTGDTFGGPDASLQDFRTHHEQNGSIVEIYCFETTCCEEQAIDQSIARKGGQPPGFCSAAVSECLRGVETIGIDESHLFPGPFRRKLRGSQTSRRRALE